MFSRTARLLGFVCYQDPPPRGFCHPTRRTERAHFKQTPCRSQERRPLDFGQSVSVLHFHLDGKFSVDVPPTSVLHRLSGSPPTVAPPSQGSHIRGYRHGGKHAYGRVTIGDKGPCTNGAAIPRRRHQGILAQFSPRRRPGSSVVDVTPDSFDPGS